MELLKLRRFFCGSVHKQLHKHIYIRYKPLDGVLLAEINYRVAENEGQDQTARMCRLILFYALRKINICSRTALYGLRAH